jgi:hypothetical protein
MYIPIIHTQADMGAPRGASQRWKVKKLGRKGWECYGRLVDKLWPQIEQAIRSLALHCEQGLVKTGGRLVRDAGYL